MKNEKHSPGLDLIRCLAAFLIVIFHSFIQSGFYYIPQMGLSMWFAGSIRWISLACIGLFLMLTGYLKSNKTDLYSCYRGFLPVFISYLFCSAISIPVQHFVFGQKFPLTQWLKYFLSFNGVSYGWYLSMYLCLTLISPFINILLKHLTNKALLLFAFVLVCISALPGATSWPIAPEFWRNLYPLTYYVLGATIRRMQPKIAPWVGLILAVAMAFAMGTVSVLSTDGELASGITWSFHDLWVAFIVVCLFLSLYKLKIPHRFRKALALGASGSLGVLMFSHLLDAWCYGLFPWLREPKRYLLLVLCICIPIYLICLVLGNILQKCVSRPARAMENLLQKLPKESLDQK